MGISQAIDRDDLLRIVEEAIERQRQRDEQNAELADAVMQRMLQESIAHRARALLGENARPNRFDLCSRLAVAVMRHGSSRRTWYSCFLSAGPAPAEDALGLAHVMDPISPWRTFERRTAALLAVRLGYDAVYRILSEPVCWPLGELANPGPGESPAQRIEASGEERQQTRSEAIAAALDSITAIRDAEEEPATGGPSMRVLMGRPE